MYQQYKVSIIVPSYNVEKYIEKTIKSILNQTMTNIEIICVNDGSKDATLTILKKMQEQDERITVIDKENEGIWKARLDGIKNATGDFIAFIDADDYIEPRYIEKLYNNIIANNSDIAICGFKRIDEKTNKVLSKEMKYKEDRIIEKDVNFEEIISINSAVWNKMYKASILKEIKNFKNPPRKLEDVIFILLVYLRTKKISFVNDYLYNYMVIEGSAMNTLKKEEIAETQEVILQIKQEYLKNNCSQQTMEILSSIAFLHFGVSIMLRISDDNDYNFKEEYDNNLKYLNDNFSEWKKTKYLKIIYCLKHKSTNLRLAIIKKIYVMHMFKMFISIYKFITNTLKIDIKW